MSDDYFSLLGLPCAAELEADTLRQHYFKAQQQFHPDKATNEKERLNHIQRSADINTAYHTLKQEDTRLYYLLKLRGVDILSDAPTVTPSPSLLMEAMEWHEAALEATTSQELQHMVSVLELDARQTISACKSALRAENIASATQAALRLRYLTKAIKDAQKKSFP
jgi:molecular chaperone HscB